MADSFKFDLVSPEALILSEEVSSVSLPATEGYVTVMANHAPFMTTIRPGVVTASLADGSETRIFVRGGFADVNGDGLTLLAEHASPLDKMKASDLDEEIRNAEARLEKADNDDLRFAGSEYLAQLTQARSELPA